jgi:hypothetical protein
MTDRKLLEAAAKAAGFVSYDHENSLATDMWSSGYRWNPLTDDGDALRLAVKLNIWPEQRQYDQPTIVVQKGAAYFDELASEPIGDDVCAATRRAIVCAAAEIGEEEK